MANEVQFKRIVQVAHALESTLCALSSSRRLACKFAPRSFLFGACGRGNAQDQATSIKDNFASDKQLDYTLWQIHTPLLAALANAENSGLVEPQLLFDQSGMRMAGVN